MNAPYVAQLVTDAIAFQDAADELHDAAGAPDATPETKRSYLAHLMAAQHTRTLVAVLERERRDRGEDAADRLAAWMGSADADALIETAWATAGR